MSAAKVSPSNEPNIPNALIMNSNIKVTYYQRDLFRKAFADYMPDIDTIKESLSL